MVADGQGERHFAVAFVAVVLVDGHGLPSLVTQLGWAACPSGRAALSPGTTGRRSAAPGTDTPSGTRSPHHAPRRSEEHTSELQSRGHLVCRLLLEKKKKHMIQARH